MKDEEDFVDDFVNQTGCDPRDYPHRDVRRLAYNMWLAGKVRAAEKYQSGNLSDSRDKFEKEAAEILKLPERVIRSARDGDDYDHIYESDNVMQPLSWWWFWWKMSRLDIEVDIKKPKQSSLPGEYHIGFDAGLESQYDIDVEAVKAAGLKVKGE
ncbi:hypothetical protein QZN18_20565 [Klebsiella variicola]|uniref:hypothetical protein n=1 Tax=Klebsiella variicola TaxID=244366 RepID=UPI00265FF827|nr:hypothetical protein [Klebsiella variicola]WKL60381.1 hypothetical protein QZN18_20565 [Klebsiella variicola]